MNIWEFFDNMNEVVYLSDLENYDIVYMNKKALAEYGNITLEEAKKKKCYEVFQNSAAPCAMCSNPRLKEGEFDETVQFEAALGRYLVKKCTIVDYNGQKCCMTIAIDVPANMQSEADNSKYEYMESMIGEGIRQAIYASTPAEGLRILIEHVGRGIKADRTVLFEDNEDGTYSNTCEWCAAGIKPIKDVSQNLEYDEFVEWVRNVKNGKFNIISSIDEIKEEFPVQYKIFKSDFVQSIVTVPLYDGSKYLGYYGIINAPRDVFKYLSEMLNIVSLFMISSIRRRKLMEELYRKSYYDQLTGFANRFALDDYIKDLDKDKPFGVVFCDLVGLKHVNDTMGHMSGDKFILKSAECIRMAFDDSSVFRIGGDEFIIACSDISEKEFEERINKLHASMAEYNVNISAGGCWRKMVVNIDDMFNEAEKFMYADKATYYKTANTKRGD